MFQLTAAEFANLQYSLCLVVIILCFFSGLVAWGTGKAPVLEMILAGRGCGIWAMAHIGSMRQ